MTAVVKSTKAGYDAISASKCINISELLTAGAGLHLKSSLLSILTVTAKYARDRRFNQ
jgi:hypothetical protein